MTTSSNQSGSGGDKPSGRRSLRRKEVVGSAFSPTTPNPPSTPDESSPTAPDTPPSTGTPAASSTASAHEAGVETPAASMREAEVTPMAPRRRATSGEPATAAPSSISAPAGDTSDVHSTQPDADADRQDLSDAPLEGDVADDVAATAVQIPARLHTWVARRASRHHTTLFDVVLDAIDAVVDADRLADLLAAYQQDNEQVSRSSVVGVRRRRGVNRRRQPTRRLNLRPTRREHTALMSLARRHGVSATVLITVCVQDHYERQRRAQPGDT